MFINRGGDYDRMGASEVPRWFIEHHANAKESEVDDWNVQCFMMLVFNSRLFPTGTDKMVGTDYLMCKDLEAIASFN